MVKTKKDEANDKINSILKSIIGNDGTVRGSDLVAKNDSVHILETPSPSFTWAVGGGGFELGRTCLFVGPESGGKSLMSLLLGAQLQRELKKEDPWIVYISSEYDMTGPKVEAMAKLCGVDISRLLVRNKNKPVDIFDWAETKIPELIRNGINVKMLVVDSIKAIQGPKEQNLDTSEDFVMMDLAAYLPKALRMLLPVSRDFGILTILVQQVNMETDLIKLKQGKKWNIPSGQALKHASDYTCMFEKIERKDCKLFDSGRTLMNGKSEQTGHRVRVTVEKNRCGAPFRVGEFDLKYSEGIVNQHVEIADLALGMTIIQRLNNVTYAYGDKTWKGRDNMIASIKEDPALQEELLREIKVRG